MVGCVLFVVTCFVCCLVFVVVNRCSLFVGCCVMCFVRCVVRWLLLVVRCVLLSVCRFVCWLLDVGCVVCRLMFVVSHFLYVA